MKNGELQSANTLTDEILESLGQKDNPLKVVIVAVLEKWETEIRLDQLEINHKSVQTTLNQITDVKP
jgi:hypothetical protein